MRKEDQQLVMSAFDGSLDSKDFQSLQRRLVVEPELLRLYRDHALLDHTLCEEYEGGEVVGPEQARTGVRRWGWAGWKWVAGTAAALALAVGFGAWQRQRAVRPAAGLANLVVASGSEVFVNDHVPGRESVLDPGATVWVQQGWVRLDFGGGASAIVEGPARVVFIGGRVVEMHEGKARFQQGGNGGAIEVRNRYFRAMDRGTEFAVKVPVSGPGELHVFDGKVELHSPQREGHLVLRAGEAVAVDARGSVEWTEARSEEFIGFLPEQRDLLVDRFEGGGELTGRLVAGGAAMWRVIDGHAEVTPQGLEGENFQAFCRLPEVFPTERYPILLVAMEAGGDEGFHTEGWAGLSLYRDQEEICFFGDSFGRGESWSLDVKQGMVPVYPSLARAGRRTVCLKYDRRSGFVELYEGPEPVGVPFVRSILAPGLSFDEIRLGASEGAMLRVQSLHLKMMDSR